MKTLSLLRPSSDTVARLVDTEAHPGFSYTLVGGTRTGDPGPDWAVDEEKRVIGHGEADFQAAVAALKQWRPFDLSWVFPVRTDVPIEPDAYFAFLSRSVGIWSINICRIVYVEDHEDEHTARFGFAYGTLETHAVRGEERFLVEWDKASDAVYFGVKKFSQPALVILRVLGPVTRWFQARFTRQAIDRMALAVASS